MTESEWDFMMMSLDQLPIDMMRVMDKISDYLDFIKDDEIKKVKYLVSTLQDKAQYAIYNECEDDIYAVWNINYCRKFIVEGFDEHEHELSYED